MLIKQFCNFGIELMTSLTQNLLSRLFRSPRFLIAAFAYQCIKNICYCYTPGIYIYVFTFKLILITITIKSFMMLPGYDSRNLHNLSG